MNWTKLRQLVTALATVIIVVASLFGYVEAETPPAKYLIFHVDAISTDLFLEQREAGNIPNIDAFFSDGTTVLGGLSLWPGGTEMIYPRMKPGLSNADHPFLGWQFYDVEEDRWVSNWEMMLKMWFGFPRRSIMSALYAHPPFLDFLAGMSMQNIPALLQQYDVVELLWFSSDHAGHVSGLEAQLASLYRFDHYFGQLTENIDLGTINVILYSDHGMTFPHDGSKITDPMYLIPVIKVIPEILGEELRGVYYPNVYLHDPATAPQVAQKLIENVHLDWALYRLDEHTLLGLHPEGTALWHSQGDRVAYIVQEGPDPFGYDQLGYKGEHLTRDEWLALTVDSRYPGAVPNVWGLSRNVNSGDVLLVINPPHVVYTLFTNTQNHKGLARTDLLVPILFRGPDLGHMAKVETMWLHELYNRYVPDIPFDQVPKRDKHHLDLRIPFGEKSLLQDGFAELRLSPLYRVNLGSRWQSRQFDVFAQYDLFSSFLTRWWLGLSLRYSSNENTWNFSPHLEAQWQYGQWGADFRLDHFEGQWDFEPTLRYFTSDYAWSVELGAWRIGLRHYW